MSRVKICGITNLEDALHAVDCGADALGFIFASSPRRMTVEQVHDIIQKLPPFVTKVGVFVDSGLEEVRSIMSSCPLDVAQLHGTESPEYCQGLFPRVIKAFRVKGSTSLEYLPTYNVNAYLLDSYVEGKPGGTGMSFNWDMAREAKKYGPVIMSGGLTSDTVRLAIAIVRPYGVDVCSGVESSPGKKDSEKVRRFVEEAKMEDR